MIDQTTSGIETTFYFIQKTWFDGDETSETNMADLAETLEEAGVDVVVANSGWWDLKGYGDEDDCGDDWETDCAENYAADLRDLAENIFAPAAAAVWRDCSCCGDETGWKEEVARLNDVAEDVMADEGYPVVKVYDMYGEDALDTMTVDGTHAIPSVYHERDARARENK